MEGWEGLSLNQYYKTLKKKKVNMKQECDNFFRRDGTQFTSLVSFATSCSIKLVSTLMDFFVQKVLVSP